MRQNDTLPEGGTPDGTEPKVRKDVVGGSVNGDEKRVIEEAQAVAGFKTMSEFVRETMLERSRRILTPKRRDDQRRREAA